MPLRLSFAAPSSRYSVRAERTLRDALYADVTSLVTGVALTISAAAISWFLTSDNLPLLLGCAALAIAMMRIFIILAHRKAVSDAYHYASMVLTIAYLLCIDALIFWAVGATSDPSILTVITFVVAINTIAIAFRSFAHERLVWMQTFAIVVPSAAAFLMRGGVFDMAAIVQILSAYYVPQRASRLRDLFLSALSYRDEAEKLAAQFRVAIDNMSHGMCMIGPDMRILVANPQLGEVLGVGAKRSLKGVRFGALIRLAQRRDALDRAGAERLAASFEATQAPHAVARMEVTGGDGRVVDLTLKRNEEGGWVLVAQDVTDQRRAREALDHAARFDAMTGLANRNTFEAQLTESLRVAQSLGLRTEVIFFDLDRFKQVNDSMGHKIGDRVIAEAANRLRQAAGPDALAARWGGDEFVLLRRGTDDGGAAGFAERMIAELSRPIWIDGAEILIGASAGVAVCGDGRASMETLLQNADMALYEAKRARGVCRMFAPAMNERARERRLLELDVQAALAARSFQLRYQPLVDLETGELVSFEALALWRHPTRGAVSPMTFVPVLEDLNLMHSFGAWALQRACEDAAAWPQAVRVGVNVSARQIDTLLDAVKRALSLSGLAPGRLELEITETAALEGGEECRRVLEAVRALGVRIALDDFGTGYSSLSHLMSLPLDKVKIDKSFTQQLGVSHRADVLVGNIARLSSQLGMRVTFEGVETPEMLERCRAVGVASEGQGWLFGRATANEEIARFFDAAQGAQAVA